MTAWITKSNRRIRFVKLITIISSWSWLNYSKVTFWLLVTYDNGVFSIDCCRLDPNVGPFFLSKLISTMPLILYLAAGETKLTVMKLFLGEVPNEKPLLRPGINKLVWSPSEILFLLSIYFDEEKELDIWLDDDFLLKSLIESMEELFLIITIFYNINRYLLVNITSW